VDPFRGGVRGAHHRAARVRADGDAHSR
jgi:hypothetical protein